MKCGENVSFMPQKDRFIFSLTEYNIKRGFERKIDIPHMSKWWMAWFHIFHIFSESDHHYFFKRRSNFGFKASYLIRRTSSCLKNI